MVETCQRCARQRRILNRLFEIVAVVLILMLACFLLPPMAKEREPAARMTAMHHLKQLGIAKHAYADPCHRSLFPFGRRHRYHRWQASRESHRVPRRPARSRHVKGHQPSRWTARSLRLIRQRHNAASQL